jgi:hypothetical protein
MGKSEREKTETPASARQAVRRSNRRTRSAYRGSPDGHFVVDYESAKKPMNSQKSRLIKVNQGNDFGHSVSMLGVEC